MLRFSLNSSFRRVGVVARHTSFKWLGVIWVYGIKFQQTCLSIIRNRQSQFHRIYPGLHRLILGEMSNMNKFDSKTILIISEGYDLKNQEHYVYKKCGLCDCFHETCSFRVWKVLVFLLVVAAIMTVMGLLIAMFGPGNTDLRYSEKESKVAPTVVKNEGRLTHSNALLRKLCLLSCIMHKYIYKG